MSLFTYIHFEREYHPNMEKKIEQKICSNCDLQYDDIDVISFAQYKKNTEDLIRKTFKGSQETLEIKDGERRPTRIGQGEHAGK